MGVAVVALYNHSIYQGTITQAVMHIAVVDYITIRFIREL